MKHELFHVKQKGKKTKTKKQSTYVFNGKFTLLQRKRKYNKKALLLWNYTCQMKEIIMFHVKHSFHGMKIVLI